MNQQSKAQGKLPDSQQGIMKDTIARCLAQFGWHKDRILDFFNKNFETAVAPTKASIWLRFDAECDRWWLTNGDFTSAGENVLATSYAIFPGGMGEYEIEQAIAALVAEMERKIAGAYSVRLLDRQDRQAPRAPSSPSPSM